MPRGPERSLWPEWSAFAWGLAEATLFFIVPDVAISFVALNSRSKAVRMVWAATAGAVVGGAVMWWLGRAHPYAVTRALDLVPGISRAMIAQVQRQTGDLGLLAVLTGPLRGVPFKIYAVEWGRSGGALLPFMLATVPARVPRFLLLAWATSGIANATRDRLRMTPSRARWLLGAFWVLFYAGYFAAHPG